MCCRLLCGPSAQLLTLARDSRDPPGMRQTQRQGIPLRRRLAFFRCPPPDPAVYLVGGCGSRLRRGGGLLGPCGTAGRARGL